jgi:hypothetical protein
MQQKSINIMQKKVTLVNYYAFKSVHRVAQWSVRVGNIRVLSARTECLIFYTIALPVDAMRSLQSQRSVLRANP